MRESFPPVSKHWVPVSKHWAPVSEDRGPASEDWTPVSEHFHSVSEHFPSRSEHFSLVRESFHPLSEPLNSGRSVFVLGSSHGRAGNALSDDAENDHAALLDRLAIAHPSVAINSPKPLHVVPIVVAQASYVPMAPIHH